jgi:hypothetical protein
MSATSFRDVSLMAIVPESEWRIPTLIGPVSATFAGSGAAAAAAGAAELEAAAVGAGACEPGPSQAPSRAPQTDTVNFNQVFMSVSLTVWP